MRDSLNYIDIDGTIVIGEGERDEAPMLYIGEKVGNGKGQKVDIAVDPLEGTTLAATSAPNAIAVMAIGDHGNFLHAPDTYMQKIAVGPKAKGSIDINLSPTENLHRIADAMNRYVEDLTVIILNRERHKELIEEVRKAGARIRLIQDGDVAGAIATAKEDSGIDVLMGIGGAPEGVLGAAALRCVGGDMQGRLAFRNENEKERALKMGIKDLNKIYGIQELAAGDVIFVATGVTSGDYLNGVEFFHGGAKTHSVVMRSKTGTIRYIEANHYFNYKEIK
jgi:fructose-1,6-bisphosphatase, class II